MKNHKFDGITDSQYMKAVSSVLSELCVSSIVEGSTALDTGLRALQGALRSRSVLAILKHADFLSSQKYEDAAKHFVGNQIASLVRKYPFADSPIDTEEVAKTTFLQNQRRMRRVNQKIRAWRYTTRVVDAHSLDTARTRPHTCAVQEMKAYIQRVLGTFSIDRVQQECDFSSGASVGVHGNATNLQRKFLADSWSVTANALSPAMRALWMNFHSRCVILEGTYKSFDEVAFGNVIRANMDLVDYNKIAVVPKTAKTGRVIAAEPLLNGFLQKGVDRYLRRRLKAVGVDLSEQGINSERARIGSKLWTAWDSLATIDLSAASDSISTELVRLLLPPDWFDYLNQIRSSCFRADGDDKSQWYETFASMGNGFCFPLESLIFAAFCHAAGTDNFTVYGDDIILPKSRALYLIELLTYFGFRVNNEKTFITGPFKESCGADWYNGADVRPFVLDEPMADLPKLYSAFNGTLRSWRTQTLLEGLRRYLWRACPKKFRFTGLDDRLTDSYFIVPLDEVMVSPLTRWNRDHQDWQWKALMSQPVTDPTIHDDRAADVAMYAMLRGASPQAMYTLRYSEKRRVRWFPEPQGITKPPKRNSIGTTEEVIAHKA